VNTLRLHCGGRTAAHPDLQPKLRHGDSSICDEPACTAEDRRVGVHRGLGHDGDLRAGRVAVSRHRGDRHPLVRQATQAGAAAGRAPTCGGSAPTCGGSAHRISARPRLIQRVTGLSLGAKLPFSVDEGSLALCTALHRAEAVSRNRRRAGERSEREGAISPYFSATLTPPVSVRSGSTTTV
jgi:hypothetical protein